MTKKSTEQQLYDAYLDLYYAGLFMDETIEEMTEHLKQIKARKRKNIRLFEKARKQYAEIYDREPLKPRS